MKQYSFFFVVFFLVGFGCGILPQFHHSVEVMLLPHHSHRFPGLSRPYRYWDRKPPLVVVRPEEPR